MKDQVWRGLKFHPAITADQINSMILNQTACLTNALFDRDVILMGGVAAADDIRFTAEEKRRFFFVQLNHHLFRRQGNQPCDWLIARQGSGMRPDKFKTLQGETKERIKVVSCQLNHPEYFWDWADLKPVFPFFERGSNKLNPYHPALEWCNQFWNEIRTNPFLSMLALRMILLFPVRSVRLYGFNFFSDVRAPVKTKVGCHHVTKQTDWLCRMYHTDFRIELEPALIKMLKLDRGPRGFFAPYDMNK
jgi:hypothetical protein